MTETIKTVTLTATVGMETIRFVSEPLTEQQLVALEAQISGNLHTFSMGYNPDNVKADDPGRSK